MLETVPAMPALPAPPGPRRLLRRLLPCLAALGVLLGGCSDLRAVTRLQSRDLAAVAPGTYRLDRHHWSVVFDVDHLGFSRYVMRFDRAGATLVWPRSGAPGASVRAWVRTASIDTNDPALDSLLCGRGMLDCRRHRLLRLQATGLRMVDAHHGLLRATLSLGRHTVPLLLHVRFHGYGVDPVDGLTTLGFSARGAFSRARLGLPAWPGLIGDTVRLRIEAEFVRPANASG